MKMAFILGPFSVGSRPLDFNVLWSSSRGLTGSELSVVSMSKEMVKRGHNVTLFTIQSTSKDSWEGVVIKNYVPGLHGEEFDAIVSINEPDCLRGISSSCVRVVCQYLNDFIYCQPGFEEFVDIWTAPSQMLLDHLTKQINTNIDKWFVVPLGCDPSLYTDQRIPGRVIWASSADRGLHWLLQEWSKIKAAVPYADLRIFYNFNYSGVDKLEHNSNSLPQFIEMGQRARYMKDAIKRLHHFGVLQVGSVSRERMQYEMSAASVLAFPVDTVIFSEGFSVTTLESHASFTVPIITDADCLGSVYKNSGAVIINSPIKNNLSEFTVSVIKALTDKVYADNVINKCRSFAEKFTWENATKKLENVIYQSPKYRKKNEAV